MQHPRPLSGFHAPLGLTGTGAIVGMATMLAYLGTILYLTVSANLLVSMGIPYNSEGGSYFFKLHPATYCFVFAFMLIAVRSNPAAMIGQVFRATPAIPVHLLVVSLAMAYCAVRYGFGGMAFLIESHLAPLFVAIVLFYLPLETRRKMLHLFVALMAVNAFLGIGEAVLQKRIVPFMAGDQPIIEDHFRATALQGHPLSNAINTTTMLFALPALVMPLRGKVALGALFALSLFAFGSRTALAAAVALGGAFAVITFFQKLWKRTYTVQELLLAVAAALSVPVMLAGAVAGLNLGERIFALLKWDSSAQSRLEVYAIFNLLDFADIMFGVGPAGIEERLNWLKQHTIVTDIENFWLLFLLYFGLPLFLVFVTSMMAVVVTLMRRAPPYPGWATAAFFILSSGNNALAVKTNDLSLIYLLLVCSAADRFMFSRDQAQKRQRLAAAVAAPAAAVGPKPQAVPSLPQRGPGLAAIPPGLAGAPRDEAAREARRAARRALIAANKTAGGEGPAPV